MRGERSSDQKESPVSEPVALRMISPINRWETGESEEAQKAKAAYLFKYIAQTGMFVYMESGAIPGMLQHLKEKFNLDYFQLGILGSVIYLSLSLGCPFFAWMYRKYNAKFILGVTVIVNNLTTLSFALCPTSLPNLFITLRAAVGLSQAGLVVYTPVWIDEFAPAGKHATWMATLQAATPFGIMFGYLAASAFTFSGKDTLLGIYTFRYPFLLQVLVVCPYAALYWIVPNKHINVLAHFKLADPSRRGNSWDEDLKLPDEEEIHEFTSLEGSIQVAPIDVEGDVEKVQLNSPSVPWKGGLSIGGGIEMGHSANSPPGQEMKGGSGSAIDAGVPEMLKGMDAVIALVRNKTYMFIVISLTALYFVVTGIQYWATDYLETELHGNSTTVRLQFLFTSATAPVAGVIFGGWFVERVGGYKGKAQRRTTLGWCTGFGCCAVVAAVFVTMVNSTWAAAGLLWVLLFFGGSVLPGGSGIFISVIPPNIRTIGSSFAAIIFNLFGYFLSPFLSGLLSEEYSSLTLGFRFILSFSLVAIIFMGLAYKT